MGRHLVSVLRPQAKGKAKDAKGKDRSAKNWVGTATTYARISRYRDTAVTVPLYTTGDIASAPCAGSS